VTAENLRPELRWAIEAAQSKKAAGVILLDLTGLGAFTDYFLVCTGFSTPQVRAICDGIEEALHAHGMRPTHREGRSGAEWQLLDYGSFIVHVFSERLRQFYDLERLWRQARRLDFSEPEGDASAAGGRLT
jgi:ribosome-associated protein